MTFLHLFLEDLLLLRPALVAQFEFPLGLNRLLSGGSVKGKARKLSFDHILSATREVVELYALPSPMQVLTGLPSNPLCGVFPFLT